MHRSTSTSCPRPSTLCPWVRASTSVVLPSSPNMTGLPPLFSLSSSCERPRRLPVAGEFVYAGALLLVLPSLLLFGASPRHVIGDLIIAACSIAARAVLSLLLVLCLHDTVATTLAHSQLVGTSSVLITLSLVDAVLFCARRQTLTPFVGAVDDNVACAVLLLSCIVHVPLGVLNFAAAMFTAMILVPYFAAATMLKSSGGAGGYVPPLHVVAVARSSSFASPLPADYSPLRVLAPPSDSIVD
jgi:hypothetical protein